ncbi:MAG: 2-nitropropane dioxygenase [Bdellovibrionales bacterium RIFCSPHIGHO2_01_FULL_40_29]|nr:MAG: 2-nitropropane dioxygenase [Bdellovibrionales bacterium RIFCSPHIGHO2_01_FULL_40_29]OFZ34962.1 MAG: 2-nitropropane dioxygenase [Bdellovibrionales bacterium RIFCSPHIGHO2_02_FULL_40_15]
MNLNQHPRLIQGGMGIAVSNWVLAKSVSQLGHLGIVSGTAINSVLVRRLQDGDPAGHMRRALNQFPSQEIVQNILSQYFIEGGKSIDQPYKRAPLYNLKSSKSLLQLTMVSSFVEVFLAKEGHAGKVGINLLEKVVLPNLACLYGALLADVDYVIMGAGIPREIPGALDLLSQNKEAHLKVPVVGATSEDHFVTTFNPSEILGESFFSKLKRPFFFPIVSSSVLAANLKKKSTGTVDGFIVESPLAGGHNAPPRGPMKLNELGEPIYGERDQVDLAEMKALGLPFWMAGYYATPEKIKEVQALGAHGIQVGTLFAFCEESGFDSALKNEVIQKILSGENPKDGWVFTDPVSSPTGFPFKAVRLSNTISEEAIYKARMRICDLGYLRHAYKKPDGQVAQRCPAEPVEDYLKKGGLLEDTMGRKCLCNALMADIGMAQKQSDQSFEKPLITAGDDLNNLMKILKMSSSGKTYRAADVIRFLEFA